MGMILVQIIRKHFYDLTTVLVRQHYVNMIVKDVIPSLVNTKMVPTSLCILE